MRLIIMGPQGSGKGTQAEMLAEELNITHISTGEQFRHEIAKGTRFGKEIEPIIDAGQMIPDALTNKLITKCIRSAKKGFILDGYPRKKEQAEFLELLTQIDKVILLTISDKVAIERIGGRRECPNGHDFHLVHNPPKKAGICDQDGLPLRKRDDDNAPAILKRLQFYQTQTKPLLDFYKGKVLEINGEQSIVDVHKEIVKKLRAKK